MRLFQGIKKLSAVLCACLLLQTCLTTPLPAKAAEMESMAVYKMRARLNETAKTINVLQTVMFTNGYADNLNELVFHLHSDAYQSSQTVPYDQQGMSSWDQADIDIQKVTVSDYKVTYTQDNQVLRVSLDRPQVRGTTVEVTISYLLKVPKAATALGYQDGVYSLTSWFPQLSTYDTYTKTWDESPLSLYGTAPAAEMGDFEVGLDLPKGYQVISTGNTVSSTTTTGGRQMHKVKVDRVRDVAIILSTKHKSVSATVDGIRINSYYRSDIPGDAGKLKAEQILSSMKDVYAFYNQTFGKYPYPEMDVIEMGTANQPVSYAQMILLDRYANIQIDAGGNFLKILARTAAAQWWGQTTGSNADEEPMLQSSFAEFSALYYFDRQFGKYHPQAPARTLRAGMKEWTSGISPVMSMDRFEGKMAYENAVYRKWPLYLEDLRMQVGDETFVRILRSFYADYSYRVAFLRDFIGEIDRICGARVATDYTANLVLEGYYPVQLELTWEEQNAIKAYESFAVIQQLQLSSSDVMIGTALARAAAGDVLYVVKPSGYKGDTDFAQGFLQREVEKYEKMGLNIEWVDDTTSLDKLKNENLLLLGNTSNNRIINSMNNYLPVTFGKDMVRLSNGITVEGRKSVCGIHAGWNPNKKDKVVLMVFWTEVPQEAGMVPLDTLLQKSIYMNINNSIVVQQN